MSTIREIAGWWRFILLSAALSAIVFVSKEFLPTATADAIIAFTTLLGGANMIFDLIGKKSWEEKVAERDREIAAKNAEIAAKNAEMATKNAENAELRRQLEELRRQQNGQSSGQ